MLNKKLYRFLDTTGDGSGTKNAVGNYSGAVQKFILKPKVDELFVIARMIINIVDSGVAKAEGYGSGSALTNGIEAKVTAGPAVVLDITDGVPIKTNAGWGQLCYDVANHDWGTNPTDDFVQVRWTFKRAGQPLYVNGDKGEQLEFILNDSFAGLTRQYFMAQGFIKPI